MKYAEKNQYLLTTNQFVKIKYFWNEDNVFIVCERTYEILRSYMAYSCIKLLFRSTIVTQNIPANENIDPCESKACKDKIMGGSFFKLGGFAFSFYLCGQC